MEAAGGALPGGQPLGGGLCSPEPVRGWPEEALERDLLEPLERGFRAGLLERGARCGLGELSAAGGAALGVGSLGGGAAPAVTSCTRSRSCTPCSDSEASSQSESPMTCRSCASTATPVRGCSFSLSSATVAEPGMLIGCCLLPCATVIFIWRRACQRRGARREISFSA